MKNGGHVNGWGSGMRGVRTAFGIRAECELVLQLAGGLMGPCCANAVEAPLHDRVQCHAQLLVIVIVQCDESERLQTSMVGAARNKHFGHAVYRAGLRMECNLDKIALFEGAKHLQNAARCREGLEFCAGALATIGLDRRQYCTAQLNAGCTILRVRLGEVSHNNRNYVMARTDTQITEEPCTYSCATLVLNLRKSPKFSEIRACCSTG